MLAKANYWIVGELMPLLLALKNQELIIKSITNDSKSKYVNQLHAMGLNIGDSVKVVSRFNGNIVIVSGGTKLAISKELALQIQVE